MTEDRLVNFSAYGQRAVVSYDSGVIHMTLEGNRLSANMDLSETEALELGSALIALSTGK